MFHLGRNKKPASRSSWSKNKLVESSISGAVAYAIRVSRFGIKAARVMQSSRSFGIKAARGMQSSAPFGCACGTDP